MHKYRKGTMKRTLEREIKAPESHSLYCIFRLHVVCSRLETRTKEAHFTVIVLHIL